MNLDRLVTSARAPNPRALERVSLLTLEQVATLAAAALAALGAAYLRLHGLGKPCLWLDEILHYDITARASSLPWYAWLIGFERENGPLYYATQWLVLPLANRELAARLAPALIGVATVALIGLTAARLDRPFTGLLATLLAAASPLHVYYSREGRPYSLLMFLATTMLFAISLDSRRRTRLLALAAFGAALTAASSFPLLASVLIASGVTLLRRQGPRRSSSIEVAIAGAAITSIALLYARFDQMEASHYFEPFSPSWISRISNALTMTALERPAFERFALLPIFLAIGGAVTLFRRRRDAFIFVASLSAGVILVSALSLQLLQHWLSVRYIAPALPAFLILAAIGIGTVARIVADMLGRFGRGTALAAAALLTLALLGVILTQNIRASERESYTKADWRSVARTVWERARRDQPVLCSNEWTRICLTFYLTEFPSRVRTPWTALSIEEAESIATPSRAAWIVAGGFESSPVTEWMSRFISIATIQSVVETVEVRFYPDRASLTLYGLSRRELEAMIDEFTRIRNRRLNFGESEGRFLLSGFAGSTSVNNAWDYRWIEGITARMALPIDIPRAATVRMSMSPFSYRGGPQQSFQLVVNDVALEWREMREEWTDYDVSVPEKLWRPGINEVTIRLTHATRPAAVSPGSSDSRLLSASIDSLQLLPAP